ncbi:RES family NAD+ phosphorylase [Pedobacter sp. AW31-3R]|uniref:RES family NAD+ phosphorylase n=1 Tax=Pedobacter sp. AW31-3R TaxID=3445781 RepID=UPI003F9F689E
MIVFRIGHKNYAATLTSSGVNGRWASAGKHVIYCAENIALAFLENMVRRQGVGFNRDFKTVFIEIPDDMAIQTIELDTLDPDWRHPYDYSHCQPQGNQWYDDMRIPILKVPSAILPGSFNYVINTLHPDFKQLHILAVTDLVPDERIEDILKKYQS